jgi:hypothetical protein
MTILLCMFLFLTPRESPAQDTDIEHQTAIQLAKVKRIYVAILTGGNSALQIRDLIMASLENTKQFIVTEDEDRADAVLKGAGGEDVFTDTFQSSEGINAHTQLGGGSSSGTRNYASSSSNRYFGATIGENDSRRTEERKHEAIATVRLVSKDGDVIWSATAESLGGKFLGAGPDVADRIAKHLAADYRAAKQLASAPGNAPVAAKAGVPALPPLHSATGLAAAKKPAR